MSAAASAVGHEFWYMGQGCAETFVSDPAFDAHRVGKFDITQGPSRRRCLTAAEMAAKGWEKTDRGWRHPRGMRDQAHKARLKVAQAA